MNNKQTTAMQELIEYSNNQIVICENEVLNSRFLIMHNKEAIRNYWEGKLDSYKELNCKATELLTKEREQIIESWQDGYVIGCSVGGNDYTTETENDTGIFYFTQNFKQD